MDSKSAYTSPNASRVERAPVDGGTPQACAGTQIPHAFILVRYFDLSPDGRSVAFLIAPGKTPSIGLRSFPLTPDATVGSISRPSSRYLRFLEIYARRKSAGASDHTEPLKTFGFSHWTVRPAARPRTSRPI